MGVLWSNGRKLHAKWGNREDSSLKKSLMSSILLLGSVQDHGFYATSLNIFRPRCNIQDSLLSWANITSVHHLVSETYLGLRFLPSFRTIRKEKESLRGPPPFESRVPWIPLLILCPHQPVVIQHASGYLLCSSLSAHLISFVAHGTCPPSSSLDSVLIFQLLKIWIWSTQHLIYLLSSSLWSWYWSSMWSPTLPIRLGFLFAHTHLLPGPSGNLNHVETTL
jgi:hypothetical protein